MLIRYTRFLLDLMHHFLFHETWNITSLTCLEQTVKVSRWGPDFALKSISRGARNACASDRFDYSPAY